MRSGEGDDQDATPDAATEGEQEVAPNDDAATIAAGATASDNEPVGVTDADADLTDDNAPAPSLPEADPTPAHSVDAEGSSVPRNDDASGTAEATDDPPDDTGPLVDPSPALPESAPMNAPPMVQQSVSPPSAPTTWYRTDDDRYRSVHRLANPWYRRAARALIGMSFIALAAIGLYFGARLVQDWLDRDTLPAAGSEVPEFRSTSFEMRSSSPAPTLDGTLTLDTETMAFEFRGRGNGTQAGVELVSPDGEQIYIRQGGEPWREATNDNVAADARRAVSYLANDNNADDILTSQLRRGYVDLVERTEVGTGDDEIRRYEVRLDTDSFSRDFPLQYREFEDRAIPGVDEVRGLVVVMTLDADDVLVEVTDDTTNWVWQRLTYSEQPFRPLDPVEEILDNTIVITDGSLGSGG